MSSDMDVATIKSGILDLARRLRPYGMDVHNEDGRTIKIQAGHVRDNRGKLRVYVDLRTRSMGPTSPEVSVLFSPQGESVSIVTDELRTLHVNGRRIELE